MNYLPTLLPTLPPTLRRAFANGGTDLLLRVRGFGFSVRKPDELEVDVGLLELLGESKLLMELGSGVRVAGAAIFGAGPRERHRRRDSGAEDEFVVAAFDEEDIVNDGLVKMSLRSIKFCS